MSVVFCSSGKLVEIADKVQRDGSKQFIVLPLVSNLTLVFAQCQQNPDSIFHFFPKSQRPSKE